MSSSRARLRTSAGGSGPAASCSSSRSVPPWPSSLRGAGGGRCLCTPKGGPDRGCAESQAGCNGPPLGLPTYCREGRYSARGRHPQSAPQHTAVPLCTCTKRAGHLHIVHVSHPCPCLHGARACTQKMPVAGQPVRRRTGTATVRPTRARRALEDQVRAARGQVGAAQLHDARRAAQQLERAPLARHERAVLVLAQRDDLHRVLLAAQLVRRAAPAGPGSR